MARCVPVIAAYVDTTLKTLLAIWAAGGRRDDEVAIESYVWPQSAKLQLASGKLRMIRDSEGHLVAYKRVYRIPARARDGAKDSAESWQKTPSGPVHVMQLKRGRKGRKVPTQQLPGFAPA